MGEALLDGLGMLLQPTSLLYLTIGMTVGLVIGFLPGLGGLATLALLTPLIIGMEPAQGLAFILGAYGSVSFGGSITAILFNTPGTGEQAVTTFDGYPMARRGQSGRALGVSAAASAFGGLFGVLILVLFIPIAMQLIRYLRPPEVFALGIVGIMVMGVSNARTRTKGIVSGALGLMLSFVGLDPVTGISRMTFGHLELNNGLGITAVTMGLFAVSEMVVLYTRGVAIAGSGSAATTKAKGSRVIDGVMDAVRNWKMVIQGGLLGGFAGTIPGLGGTVAMFGAYGFARARSKDPDSFGKGNPIGVLAPESANNAKEGGSFVPTLSFGIPGTSGMALVIGILLILGFVPGPDMIENNLNIVFLIAWIVALSNILASLLGLAMAPGLAKLAFLRPQILAPALITIALIGSFIESLVMMSIVVALAFGIVGYVFRAMGYSNAGLIMGFVLGPVVDQNFNLSLQIYGPEFVFRPITGGLILLVVVGALWGPVKGHVLRVRIKERARRRMEPNARPRSRGERRFELLLAAALLAFAAWYGLTMYSYPADAGRVPAIVAAVMAGALVVQIVIHLRRPAESDPAVEVNGSSGRGEASEVAYPTNEPEPDTYDTLIALSGIRRRRFFTIAAFAAAFYYGTLLFGFVVTSGVLITAILLVSRERVWTAVAGGMAGFGAAYGLVTVLLGMNPLDGYLLG